MIVNMDSWIRGNIGKEPVKENGQTESIIFRIMLMFHTNMWKCIVIHFHIFLCNISIILNMILSFCPFSFTHSFPIFYLIELMRPYFHLFCQELPDVSHQTPQKVLILVLGEWYSNYYIVPEMVNKYNLWQVGSMPFLLTEYRKFMVGQSLV